MDINIGKSHLLSSDKSEPAASNLMSEGWDWVKSHPVETAVGVCALATGLTLGARALAARAEGRALAATENGALSITNLELGGARNGALSLGARAEGSVLAATDIQLGGAGASIGRLGEGIVVKTFTIEPALANAADREVALDYSATMQAAPKIVRLPEGFDPRQALADRASALEALASGKVKPAPISISWGKAP